jgi:hypothetical protein
MGGGKVHIGFGGGNLRKRDPLGRPRFRYVNYTNMDFQEL